MFACFVSISRCEAGEPTVNFSDTTARARLEFSHNTGAFGLKLWPEPFGSGACFIDIDQDGWQDIVFINSTDWPANALRRAAESDIRGVHLYQDELKRRRSDQPKTLDHRKSSIVVFRNNRDGTFTDQTEKAGVVSTFYGMGCAAADYDNDGDADFYVTAYGGGTLWRNNGGGTFTDVTTASGITDHGWSTCAVWFDIDRDGHLDLFICHYVNWTLEANFQCGFDRDRMVYCGPDVYPGSLQMLWRNDGDGTFTDISQPAGFGKLYGKALGAAVLDYDHDGWLDLVVANDQVPNFLLHNNGDGTFTDESVLLGFSAGRFGIAKAGMGIDIADYQNTRQAGIVVGNFAKEGLTLHQQGRGNVFKDQAPRAGLKRPSLPFLTFGLFFFDYDLDGYLDILAANGHIDEATVKYLEREVMHEQRLLLFHNEGNGTFTEVGRKSGRALKKKLVGRGAAYADIDMDGDLDVLITQNNGPAILLRNDGGNRHHWLRVVLEGTASNRDGIGAAVTVTAGGQTQHRLVKTGSSYLSQSELPVTFGLGSAEEVDEIVIQWPSGTIDRLTAIPVDQIVFVMEGSTVPDRTPRSTPGVE